MCNERRQGLRAMKYRVEERGAGSGWGGRGSARVSLEEL